MKNVILLSLGLLVLGGCASTLTGNKSEPEWVAAPQPGGESQYGANAFYGRGKSTLSDLDTALSEAQDEARTQVAAALQTEIEKESSKTQKALVTSLSEGIPEAKKTKLQENVTKEFKNVEKNLINVNLRGSTIVASWRDKEKDLTFVLAKIDKEQAQRAMIQEFNEAAKRATKSVVASDDQVISGIVSASVGK